MTYPYRPIKRRNPAARRDALIRSRVLLADRRYRRGRDARAVVACLACGWAATDVDDHDVQTGTGALFPLDEHTPEQCAAILRARREADGQ